ncbi:MAG: hypothetical protein U1C97_01200, partial [Candidatus Gracilibacteria bacterium]|nr:hypothetical protein [Candidatus Gracilibacteria bacterium]
MKRQGKSYRKAGFFFFFAGVFLVTFITFQGILSGWFSAQIFPEPVKSWLEEPSFGGVKEDYFSPQSEDDLRRYRAQETEQYYFLGQYDRELFLPTPDVFEEAVPSPSPAEGSLPAQDENIQGGPSDVVPEDSVGPAEQPVVEPVTEPAVDEVVDVLPDETVPSEEILDPVPAEVPVPEESAPETIPPTPSDNSEEPVGFIENFSRKLSGFFSALFFSWSEAPAQVVEVPVEPSVGDPASVPAEDIAPDAVIDSAETPPDEVIAPDAVIDSAETPPDESSVPEVFPSEGLPSESAPSQESVSQKGEYGERLKQLRPEFLDNEDSILLFHQKAIRDLSDAMIMVKKDFSLGLHALRFDDEQKTLSFLPQEGYNASFDSGMVVFANQTRPESVSYFYDRDQRALKQWVLLKDGFNDAYEFSREIQSAEEYHVEAMADGGFFVWKKNFQDSRPFVFTPPQLIDGYGEIGSGVIEARYLDGRFILRITHPEVLTFPLLLQQDILMPIDQRVEDSQNTAQLSFLYDQPFLFEKNLGQWDDSIVFGAQKDRASYFLQNRE